jgi:hypothetical protein
VRSQLISSHQPTRFSRRTCDFRWRCFGGRQSVETKHGRAIDRLSLSLYQVEWRGLSGRNPWIHPSISTINVFHGPRRRPVRWVARFLRSDVRMRSGQARNHVAAFALASMPSTSSHTRTPLLFFRSPSCDNKFIIIEQSLYVEKASTIFYFITGRQTQTLVSAS